MLQLQSIVCVSERICIALHGTYGGFVAANLTKYGLQTAFLWHYIIATLEPLIEITIK